MYKSTNRELFHIHTRRCKHAEYVSDEEYVKKAVELGASRIVFTDHAPFPGNPFGNRMDIEELPEYISTINGLKEKYKDSIEILCGLETEYLPSFDSYIHELKEMNGMDLLILGQHIYELPDRPMEWSFSLEDKFKEHIHLSNAIIHGINTGLFDVVAHPDRIFRRVKQWNNECTDIADAIVTAARQMSIPLEQNYSSMRRKNQYRIEFWNMINNSDMIIEGIDAHSIREMEEWANQNESW